MCSGIKIVRGMAAGASLAVVVCFLGGCLYIPTPQRRAFEGTEVKQDELAFLQPAVTTKEEVIQRFGNPAFLWRDENILVYRWVKQRGIMLWGVAAGYSASFGAVDVTQEFAFLLKFDPDERFVSSEIVAKPAMKNYGDFLLDWRDAQRARDWKQKETEP